MAPRPRGDIRSVLVAVRLTPAEKKELDRLTEDRGISEFIRERIFHR